MELGVERLVRHGAVVAIGSDLAGCGCEGVNELLRRRDREGDIYSVFPPGHRVWLDDKGKEIDPGNCTI